MPIKVTALLLAFFQNNSNYKQKNQEIMILKKAIVQFDIWHICITYNSMIIK